jgi:transcriptional regulator GlxA family with amidase domain
VNSVTHQVTILVYDGVKLLDVAGPAEVFGEANRLGADYRIVLLSPAGADVTSSTGIRIAVDGAVASDVASDVAPYVASDVASGSAAAPGSASASASTPGPASRTFLVAGADIYPRSPVAADLVRAARTLAARGGRTASICTGAFVLGAAGLLDGKRATTHWKVAHELAARCPASRVEPDAIYVRDGATYTSAGVTAGIDLALALVEEDHGPDLTREVARALVVYLQRSGGQSQFSAPLQGPPPRSPALRLITDRVTADPGGNHSLGELAKHLNVSPRHLTRLFHDELSTTPGRYVEMIRFDMAKALLDQGYTATQSAALAGFPSYESLRRVFVRELSLSPAAYQRRFSTARRTEAE